MLLKFTRIIIIIENNHTFHKRVMIDVKIFNYFSDTLQRNTGLVLSLFGYFEYHSINCHYSVLVLGVVDIAKQYIISFLRMILSDQKSANNISI